MKLSENQAEAVVRLQSNSDFKLWAEALQAYGLALNEQAICGPEESSGVHRGMARSVSEVLRTLGTAGNVLFQLRSRSR